MVVVLVIRIMVCSSSWQAKTPPPPKIVLLCTGLLVNPWCVVELDPICLRTTVEHSAQPRPSPFPGIYHGGWDQYWYSLIILILIPVLVPVFSPPMGEGNWDQYGYSRIPIGPALGPTPCHPSPHNSACFSAFCCITLWAFHKGQ